MSESEPMAGGNSGPVIRVGDTVRRVAGPWTPQVQDLMRGLRARGVSVVPEPLGLDELGREVVEYGAGDDLPEQQRRMRVFCDAYGDVEPAEVLHWAIVRLDDLIGYSLEQVAAGNPTFVTTHAEGHTALYQRHVDWIRRYWRP